MNRIAITLQLIGPYLPPHKLYFKSSKLTWPYSSFSTEKQLNLEEGKKNYYRVLGVKSSSSFQQIKSQYLQCSKKYHPDVLKAIAKTQKQELLKSDQNLSSKFVEIQEAFKTLSNSRTRRLHDLQIGIQDSLWIRQQFYGRSQHLQNEQFNKILNLNISMENIQVGMNMRQRLMVKYASQLQQPSIKDYIKGLWFPFLTFSLFWAIWYAIENIVGRYRGSRTILTSQVQGLAKFTVIPINFK